MLLSERSITSAGRAAPADSLRAALRTADFGAGLEQQPGGPRFRQPRAVELAVLEQLVGLGIFGGVDGDVASTVRGGPVALFAEPGAEGHVLRAPSCGVSPRPALRVPQYGDDEVGRGINGEPVGCPARGRRHVPAPLVVCGLAYFVATARAPRPSPSPRSTRLACPRRSPPSTAP